MLQHEITPFANAHIENLEEAGKTLADVLLSFDGPVVGITRDDIVKALHNVQNAKAGFVRFRDCAEDEWKMKERYADKARHCRLRHKDQE